MHARPFTSSLVMSAILGPFACGCGSTEPTFGVEAGSDSASHPNGGEASDASAADLVAIDAAPVGDEDTVSDGAVSDGPFADSAAIDGARPDGTADAATDGGSSVTSRDVGFEVSLPGDAALLVDSTVAEAGGPPNVDAGVNPCAFDGNVPNLPIGDAGATTVGCTACVSASCGAQAAACTSSCACTTQLGALLVCASSGQSVLSCLATTPGSATVTALALCVATACAAPCGI